MFRISDVCCCKVELETWSYARNEYATKVLDTTDELFIYRIGTKNVIAISKNVLT